MSKICCDEYLNFGCFDACDLLLSNIDVISTGAGVHTLEFQWGAKTYNTTYTAAGASEILEFENILPVGITYFTITDPDSVTTCYYIKIERSEAVCPGVIIDDKTLSTC